MSLHAYSANLTKIHSIGNARLSGLQADLNMTDGDYSLALSEYKFSEVRKYQLNLTICAKGLFFVSYNLCEVPANLMLKKLRPRIWLSLIVFLFGVVMVSLFGQATPLQ